MIISEPNISKQRNFILDYKINVAMYLRNKDLGIYEHIKGDEYICLEWESWSLYRCYSSRNIGLKEFETFIRSITTDIRSTKLEAVIAEDFNTKAVMWGSQITDTRGEYLMNWASELGLNVINSGDTPTFERGISKSYIHSE